VAAASGSTTSHYSSTQREKKNARQGKIRRGQGDGARKHEVGMGQGRPAHNSGGWCHVFFLLHPRGRVRFTIIQTRQHTTRHCTTQQLHNTTSSRSSHLLLIIYISIDWFHRSILQYLAGTMIHGASAHPFALPFCLPSDETSTTTKITTITTCL